MSISTTELKAEVDKRRTFAIISHPDAGKTTLTEKLLLYGGAIHLAGAVKAKTTQRHTTSDWMEIEKQRGISISTSVLQFSYEDHIVNLLDTPGHKDFSEDTYRTLMAADAAVMLIDSAKGVEPQTRKLFEVCRMRGIPIFTFINKMDREGQDPFDLLEEIEKLLGISTCPLSWPIGQGSRFRGVYDRRANEVLLFDTGGVANAKDRIEAIKVNGIDDPKFIEIAAGPNRDMEEGKEILDRLKADIELLETAGNAFDQEFVDAGELSPVFFGSALKNFGVERFLQHFLKLAPKPSARISGPKSEHPEPIQPDSPNFSGFIFKIQANMDPMHRDRVAFMRITSGQFERNVMVTDSRSNTEMKLSRPLTFFGQERVIVDQAYPGDIIGLVDTQGDFRIGDTLFAGSKRISFGGMPQFSPEYYATVVIKDPMKRKQLKKGLDQLSEEGVIQVYNQRGLGDKDPFLAAVGALQFEVLQHRLMGEYSVDVRIEKLPYIHTRWIHEVDPKKPFDPEFFERREDSRCLTDRDGLPVVLFKSDWALRWASENYKNIEFLKTSPFVSN